MPTSVDAQCTRSAEKNEAWLSIVPAAMNELLNTYYNQPPPYRIVSNIHTMP